MADQEVKAPDSYIPPQSPSEISATTQIPTTDQVFRENFRIIPEEERQPAFNPQTEPEDLTPAFSGDKEIKLDGKMYEVLQEDPNNPDKPIELDSDKILAIEAKPGDGFVIKTGKDQEIRLLYDYTREWTINGAHARYDLDRNPTSRVAIGTDSWWLEGFKRGYPQQAQHPASHEAPVLVSVQRIPSVPTMPPVSSR